MAIPMAMGTSAIDPLLVAFWRLLASFGLRNGSIGAVTSTAATMSPPA
jgi:hypothetical protein